MPIIKNFSPYKIVIDGLNALRENEKTVICGRFGIDSDRKTLSAIGKQLNLSRERIRQIEREGLRKLSVHIIEEQSIWIEKILDAFEKNGGIVNQDNIAEKFLEEVYTISEKEYNSLALIFVLIPQLIKIEKTRELESGWMLASLSKKDAISVLNDWIKHLQNAKKPQHINVLIEQFPEHKKHKVAFLSELPSVSKDLVKTENGLVGLSDWPEVNPKNIRDKIFYILKKTNEPMHFDEITKAIKEKLFDGKSVVRATVHNELIADLRFVLIGRGIYALKEWGYYEGTVLDVIKNILKDKKDGLSASKIVEEVLKQRKVRRNTIMINLQTKKDFVKVSPDCYALKKL